MNWVIYLFGSGVVFFVGAALVFAAVAGFAYGHRALASLSVACGLILIAASATPLPYWYYGIAGAISVIWLTVERSSNTRWLAYRRRLRLYVVIAWIAGLAFEVPYHLVPTIKAIGRPTLYVIGDSVSAGIKTNEEGTWPQVFAKTHAITVGDFSQMGATARSALKQADQLPNEGGLVLLEIGGNDLLGDTTVSEFEKSLAALLLKVCRPGRTVVMFELPLPPFQNEFGRIQRRLAAQYGVALIPKRVFVSVLTTEGATLDGVHLSKSGHKQMADVVWKLIGSADDAKVLK